MKHMHTLSNTRPVQASLIETQQKAAVIVTLVNAFAALGNALETWLGLAPKN